MFLDVVVSGTMMTIDVEKTTNITDAFALTNDQAQNDRQIEPKKGIMDHNIQMHFWLKTRF